MYHGLFWRSFLLEVIWKTPGNVAKRPGERKWRLRAKTRKNAIFRVLGTPVRQPGEVCDGCAADGWLYGDLFAETPILESVPGLREATSYICKVAKSKKFTLSKINFSA